MRAKRYGLGIVLAAFFVLLLAPAAEAALPVGTEFSFVDWETPLGILAGGVGTEYEYDHFLEDAVFHPINLEGGEIINITTNALSVFQLNITPTSPMRLSVYLDDLFLGESEEFTTYTSGHLWSINMEGDDLLNAMEDRRGIVKWKITQGSGTLMIATSTVYGTGEVVVPEPASVLLFGSGLVALGYGRKKKKLKNF